MLSVPALSKLVSLATRSIPAPFSPIIPLGVLTRLWLNTPWPHQVFAPSRPSIRVLFHPKSRFRQLIRPSLPVLQRTSSWNASLFSTARTGGSGFALGREHDLAHAEVAERVADGNLAIAAVCCHRFRNIVNQLADALNGGDEHGSVRWIADEDGVVEHDAVLVVHDLGFVTELDRLAESTLADRAGVGVMQRDKACGSLRDASGQALASLVHDAGHPLDGHLEVVGDRLES